LAARRARRVFAFEPDPTSAALLHKSVQHGAFKNVEINEACVSDSDGGATLWKSDTFDGDNSIVRHTGRESIRVRSVTLDECFQDETIDLLKVDAQGAEPLIFKGAKRMIEEGRIRSVVLEWDPRYWSPEFRTLLLAFDVYDVQGRILSEMPPQKTDVLLRLRV
jgi:FkbM family methyltransferase